MNNSPYHRKAINVTIVAFTRAYLISNKKLALKMIQIKINEKLICI